MTTLPAVTIWQPWASLVAARAKPYEFRGWAAPPAYRGRRIAIHAGARKVVAAELQALRLQLRIDPLATGLIAALALPLLERWTDEPDALPLSSIVCTALLGHPRQAFDLPEYAQRFINDSERREHATWGWPLSDIRPLRPPVPYRGARGFWPCELEDIAA
jgi:hypothetical protein